MKSYIKKYISYIIGTAVGILAGGLFKSEKSKSTK